jgi:hypothetical protein
MFLMFKLNEGGRWLIGASDTLEGARREVLGFAELWPDEYAILNQDTGEWNLFPANQERVPNLVRGSQNPSSEVRTHRPT